MLNIISGDESWVSNYNQVIAIMCWNAAHSKHGSRFCFFGHINTIVPLPSALLGRFGSYNFALFSKLKFKLNARCSDTLEVIQQTLQPLKCSGQNRTSREYHKNVSGATGMSCNIQLDVSDSHSADRLMGLLIRVEALCLQWLF